MDECSAHVVNVDEIARDVLIHETRESAAHSFVHERGDEPGRVFIRAIDRVQTEVDTREALMATQPESYES